MYFKVRDSLTVMRRVTRRVNAGTERVISGKSLAGEADDIMNSTRLQL